MAAAVLRELVDLHRRQLAGVIEVRGVGRLRKLYAESRAELEDKLRRLARAGKGSTFTAHHLRQVLAQVTDVARGFQGDLQEHMEKTGRLAGSLAPRHLTHTIGVMQTRFGRMTPVVQAAQAAVVRGAYASVAPTLIDHYRRSARTYGPQAVVAIRNGLARSILQNETVDEAIDRVSGSGGLFDQQRWRAERTVRTEMSYSYGVANQRSMEQMRPAVPQMMKRLVATRDSREGDDSKELDGQTVPVTEPFLWHVKDARGNPTGKVVRYMQPPNRPNDREVVIPWLASWGSGPVASAGEVRPAPVPEA